MECQTPGVLDRRWLGITHSKIRIVIMTTVVCYGVGDDEHITCIDIAR